MGDKVYGKIISNLLGNREGLEMAQFFSTWWLVLLTGKTFMGEKFSIFVHPGH